MKKGISFQGFVPVRTEPYHTAEMGSQLLFGETFRALETSGSWVRISIDFDGFEGWVEPSSIQMIPGGDKENSTMKTEPVGKGQIEEEPLDGAGNIPSNAETDSKYRIAIQPSVTVRDLTHNRPLILPAGSIWNSTSGNTLSVRERQFELLSEEGWVIPGHGADPVEIGNQLLSVPGLYGGRCGFGFDGPGLVQMLCRTLGIYLPRHCAGQAEAGSTINFIHEALKGDLAFFDNEEGEIIHSGMVLGDGTVLHAHDQVRIDRLDQQGIYCAETEAYTHKLRIIKRVVGQS